MNNKEYKYFVPLPENTEQLKTQYKNLCRKLHPDIGGKTEDFQAMQEEYGRVLEHLKNTTEQAEEKAEIVDMIFKYVSSIREVSPEVNNVCAAAKSILNGVDKIAPLNGIIKQIERLL